MRDGTVSMMNRVLITTENNLFHLHIDVYINVVCTILHCARATGLYFECCKMAQLALKYQAKCFL